MSGKEETLGSLVLFNDVTNQLNRDTCYSTLHACMFTYNIVHAYSPPPVPPGEESRDPVSRHVY